MIKVKDIADVIEHFAPKSLQESYDNTGLQVGDPEMGVTAALLCLDVTEDIIDEALERHCNLVISHHPLLFKGLKSVTGSSASERIVIKAIRNNIAIYSAHTNLDSTWDGVSHEMGRKLKISDVEVLEPSAPGANTGLGIIGNITPTPTLEFLRKVKELFGVKALKFSREWGGIVVKRVALCGGSGASLIGKALQKGADAIITGDVKYHDFTTFGHDLLIADIGHFESERCATNLLSRLIRENCPDIILYFSEREKNPVNTL